MSDHFSLPSRWADSPVRITLVGAGGTGSQIADQLASLQATLIRLGHPGFQVTIYDPDRVSASNVGRQRYCDADVGHAKALLLCHRINQFYGLTWQARPTRFEVPDPHAYFSTDLIITAVDKAIFRAELGAAFAGVTLDTLWLDLGNGASDGQVICGHLGTPRCSARLPNVFDLFPELATMHAADNEAPSCSAEEAIQRQAWPINRLAALTAAELLWTLFRNGRITTHGAFFRLAPMTVSPLPIDPATWAFYGYTGGDQHAAAA